MEKGCYSEVFNQFYVSGKWLRDEDGTNFYKIFTFSFSDPSDHSTFKLLDYYEQKTSGFQTAKDSVTKYLLCGSTSVFQVNTSIEFSGAPTYGYVSTDGVSFVESYSFRTYSFPVVSYLKANNTFLIFIYGDSNEGFQASVGGLPNSWVNYPAITTERSYGDVINAVNVDGLHTYIATQGGYMMKASSLAGPWSLVFAPPSPGYTYNAFVATSSPIAYSLLNHDTKEVSTNNVYYSNDGSSWTKSALNSSIGEIFALDSVSSYWAIIPKALHNHIYISLDGLNYGVLPVYNLFPFINSTDFGFDWVIYAQDRFLLKSRYYLWESTNPVDMNNWKGTPSPYYINAETPAPIYSVELGIYAIQLYSFNTVAISSDGIHWNRAESLPASAKQMIQHMPITFSDSSVLVSGNYGVWALNITSDVPSSWKMMTSSVVESLFGVPQLDMVLGAQKLTNYVDDLVYSKDGGMTWNMLFPAVPRVYNVWYSTDEMVYSFYNYPTIASVCSYAPMSNISNWWKHDLINLAGDITSVGSIGETVIWAGYQNMMFPELNQNLISSTSDGVHFVSYPYDPLIDHMPLIMAFDPEGKYGVAVSPNINLISLWDNPSASINNPMYYDQY